jgi:hypothetical protein
VSMLQQSEPLFISQPAGIPAGSMSPDMCFTIVMAACLFVDAGLVSILIRICNSFGVPWVPVIVVATFGTILLALRVGATLRAAAQDQGG